MIKAAALGGVAAAGVIADVLVDANTHVALGGAIAVAVTVAGIAIWLGREFQWIRDRDLLVSQKLDAQAKLTAEWRKSVMERFESLPCREGHPKKRVDCSEERKG